MPPPVATSPEKAQDALSGAPRSEDSAKAAHGAPEPIPAHLVSALAGLPDHLKPENVEKHMPARPINNPALAAHILERDAEAAAEGRPRTAKQIAKAYREEGKQARLAYRERLAEIMAEVVEPVPTGDPQEDARQHRIYSTWVANRASCESLADALAVVHSAMTDPTVSPTSLKAAEMVITRATYDVATFITHALDLDERLSVEKRMAIVSRAYSNGKISSGELQAVINALKAESEVIASELIEKLEALQAQADAKTIPHVKA